MDAFDKNCNETDDGLSPVYSASYDHLGIILWGEEKVEKHLDIQTDRLRRYSGFKAGLDHEVFTYDYLHEKSPMLLKKLKEALDSFQGRLGVGSCSYGQPLSVFINEESNIRQLALALDTTEKLLDYKVTVYVMMEHAFHAQLPQLLAGCGFEGAVLRTHFMIYGHNPEFDAPVGWWTGIDGSRIKTLPTYKGQGHTPPRFYYKIPGSTTTLDHRILCDAPTKEYPVTLKQFREKFGKRIRPLVATRAGDPTSHEELIIAHLYDPDYKWVLLEDIFRLLPEPRSEFRTQPNDFIVRMPWGYCGNRILNKTREAEIKVLTAERLAAINSALGGASYEKEIEASWKNLCVAQHHDIQICGLEEDARSYLSGSFKYSGIVSENSMNEIAPRIGYGKRYVVFNPLPWERTEWVDTSGVGFSVMVPGLGFKAVVNACGGDSNQSCTCCREKDFNWQSQGVHDDGLCSPVVNKTEAGYELVTEPDDTGRLKTPFYEVYTSHNGGFRLIRSRITGANLLVPPKTSGTLAATINGRDCESVGRFTEANIEDGRAVLVEKGEIGGIPYRSEWSFYSHSPRIDWHGEIDFNNELVGHLKKPSDLDIVKNMEPEIWDKDLDENIKVTANDGHEYKLRLRFYPYYTPPVTGVRDLPFSISETPGPYIEGVYWTAVSDGYVGLCLFNRGLMGSVHESDGALSSVLAFALPYVWHTRMLKGKYTFDLGVLPFEGDWKHAGLHRQAIEYNFPFVSQEVQECRDSLGEIWSPYKDTGDGRAIMSALYTKGGSNYIRFYECEGGNSTVSFEWMGKPARLTQCNMREKELCDIGGEIQLGPWQIETLKFDVTI